ncbi:MAG: adenylate/guanylate cyclase domain-containing protein [Planctomycetales bacterium]|nr:adenylate/guanylate cyclase domain-containing protein [Planctomycetales bacterium]
MFTDIRDFTSRSSRETRTGLEELLRTHEALLLPVIQFHQGRVVKTIGDAFLVCFESPTNAVLCGVLIQRRLREFNATAPEAKRIEVRVAVNSGEVTVRGGDVFGEPVNIAARIQGITEPGEVYFTEATYLAMQKAEVPSSEVGERRLKGVPEAIRVYKVIQDEDNALYRRIVEQNPIRAVDLPPTPPTEMVAWPPPPGRLTPRPRLVGPAGVAVLALLLSGGAFAATVSWRHARRHDPAREALAAGDLARAADLAGALLRREGSDAEAMAILGEALRGQFLGLEKGGDLTALQGAWSRAQTENPTLASLPALGREVRLATVRMRLARGETAPALETALQMHEADKSDAEAARLVVEALAADIRGDWERNGRRNPWDFRKRLAERSERHGALPGWPAARAEILHAAGMELIPNEHGNWRGVGAACLFEFIQENPADPRRIAALAALAMAGELRDLDRIAAEIGKDPALAAREDLREAVVTWVGKNYDLDDKEDVAARRFLWDTWGTKSEGMIREWLGSAEEPRRFNAFAILDAAGKLSEAERDRHLAWVLLRDTNSWREAEREAALVHWEKALASGAEAARARGAAALPEGPAPAEGLGQGNGTKWDEGGVRWRRVASECFYETLRPALEAAVPGDRWDDRNAARKILAAKGALDPAAAARCFRRNVEQWDPRYWPNEDVTEAVAYFEKAERASLPDLPAVLDALREAEDAAAERIPQIEQDKSYSSSGRRNAIERYAALRDGCARARARLGG